MFIAFSDALIPQVTRRYGCCTFGQVNALTAQVKDL